MLGARLDRTDASLSSANGHNGVAIADLAAAAHELSPWRLPGSRPVAETDPAASPGTQRAA